jgi:MoxR-like ATPase
MSSKSEVKENPNPNPGSQTFSNIDQIRERILSIERKLNTVVIGHEEMVKALILASVAGEHVVIIGPPGTAKSYLVKSFAKLLNAKYYQYLLTKFTSYDELFGSIDIIALSKGEYKRNWSRIISADIIFLDEIFKANSAVLNALLSLLQERIVYDPMTGTEIQVALHTAVGASNETPEDPELQALFDRFSLRVFIDYLNDDIAIQKAIESRWIASSNGLKPVATIQDLKLMHQYAMSIFTMRVKGLDEMYKIYHSNFMQFIKSLRSKGVIVSDRTIIEKLPKIFSAYLSLYGITLDNIMNAPYDLLPLLAHNKSEYVEIRKSLDESLGEVAELSKKLEEAKKLARVHEYKSAKERLEQILSYDLNKLSSKPWLKPRVEAIISIAKDYLEKINQKLRELQIELGVDEL